MLENKLGVNNYESMSRPFGTNLTDPKFLSYCRVANPGICQPDFNLSSGAALGTAASMAVAIASMLVAMVLQ